MKLSIITLAAIGVAALSSSGFAAGIGSVSSGNLTGGLDRTSYTRKTELVDSSPIAVPQDRVSIDFVLKQPHEPRKIRRN